MVSSMRRITPKTWIFLAMALGVGALGAAQAPQQKNTEPVQQRPAKSSDKDKQPGRKPTLAGTARVSTDAALKDAAKQAAKKPEHAKEPSASEAVLEFHPAEAEGATSTSVKSESPKSKKAKDVHGTVYGATDAKNVGTHRAGGAVGATSKSGKTSVYVQSEGDRTTPPH